MRVPGQARCPESRAAGLVVEMGNFRCRVATSSLMPDGRHAAPRRHARRDGTRHCAEELTSLQNLAALAGSASWLERIGAIARIRYKTWVRTVIGDGTKLADLLLLLRSHPAAPSESLARRARGKCQPPVLLGRRHRDSQCRGDLGDGHPAEVAQGHDLGLALVPRAQPVEGLVDRDDIQSLLLEVVHHRSRAERASSPVAARRRRSAAGRGR